MAEEAVGSYPFEEWAEEVKNALLGKGVDAEVSYAGPRAYPVFIDEEDSDKAQEILSDLGYFSCSTDGRASLSGVLDWRPDQKGPFLTFEETGDEGEELRVEIASAIEDKLQEMADAGAAMAWSTPTDDMGEDVWVWAQFGSSYAVNGDLVDGVPPTPDGYSLTRQGGSVPTAEEHVGMEHVLRAVERQYSNHAPEIVKVVIADIWHKDYKGAQEVPWSVSGDVETYEKDKGDGEDE